MMITTARTYMCAQYIGHNASRTHPSVYKFAETRNKMREDGIYLQ